MEKLLLVLVGLWGLVLVPSRAPRSPVKVGAFPAAAECKAEVTFPLISTDPPVLGPATIYCHNPCAAGCQTIVMEISVETQQGTITIQVHACACDGELASTCCQVVFYRPPGSSGGPLPWGDCGVGGCPVAGTCKAIGEQNPDTGDFEFVGRCKPSSPPGGGGGGG